MAVWMGLNGVAWLSHWDVYPYVLLNLCLSCLAGLQGAILLIAAKRSDQIASELAHHDFDVNQKALAEIERNTQITQEALAKLEALVQQAHS
jgi:uncharacterized membrane protein